MRKRSFAGVCPPLSISSACCGFGTVPDNLFSLSSSLRARRCLIAFKRNPLALLPGTVGCPARYIWAGGSV